jgi:peptidyl-prolyl cis-trans isomerase SurA
MRHLIILALAAALALAPMGGLRAQGLFAPAAAVDGAVITRWQVEQRARFLQLLNAPQADFDGARDALVAEAIQAQEARARGVEVPPEAVEEGIAEFAGRGNLTPEQLVQLLTQAGVSSETLRDFVLNGLLWRRLVQGRFSASARPDEAELSRRLAGGDPRAAITVALSEIALPLTPETRAEVLALAQELSDTLRGESAFAAAARRFSRAPTAPRGGRLDPIRLSELAPPVADQVLNLPDGGVTEPVNFGSFVGVFQLRGLSQGATPAPAGLVLEYAEVLIPGGRSPAALAEAGRLRAQADVCDDLYGVAGGLPLIRRTQPPSALPADLRQELAKLDPGEISTLIARDGVLRVVMLCDRTAGAEPEMREALGGRLLGARLESYADAYLEELRADARVELY